MRHLSFVNSARGQCKWGAIALVALFMLGCKQVGEMAVEGALSAVEEIEERNAEAAQARIDLKPGPASERSEMENGAIRFANSDIAGDRARIKESFCGSPPDLSHLPPEFFKFELSAYIPEGTSAQCRAAVDRKFPGLSSCYLVFENGSTGYVNCYIDSESKGASCMSVKKLLWEILWNEELRRDCPEPEKNAHG